VSRAPVVIVSTGAANIASVRAALWRLGLESRIAEGAEDVRGARLVVLPGVGAFGPAMQRLRERGLDETIAERVRNDRPLLAICLGMQLLCEGSEEAPGVRGVGVVPGFVGRFAGEVRVPQMGWNLVEPVGDGALIRRDWMYFANSYRLEGTPGGWKVATTSHGGAFVSAVERGAVLACQFHPELSGGAGLALIERWAAMSRKRGGVRC
jgi:imidazole glycerol phosphate synthase glutamine amidotransferase subunit